MNWYKVKLSEQIETLKGFAFKSSWYLSEGVPIVKVSNFTDDSIDEINLDYVDKKIASDYHKYSLDIDDIIIQTVGSWPRNPKSVVGKVIRVQRNLKGALLNQNAVKIIPKNSINKRYLFYCLKNDLFKNYIINCAQGAANQASITLEDIRRFEFDIAPNETQQKIASILSAYDDLIENNNRRLKILEEMAQTIYREWFINFRFPEHEKVKFVESSLGKIPEGWEVKNLSDVTKNYDSKRRPISSLQRLEMKGKYPYFGAAKIIDYINDFIFDGKYILMAEDGSVITNNSTPMLQYVNEQFWANNHTHILQGIGQVTTEFLYLFLSRYDISGHITGVAQPKINQENMNRIKILFANNETMERLNEIIIPIFDLRISLEKKNNNLHKTRDLLLPKLMNGEVSV